MASEVVSPPSHTTMFFLMLSELIYWTLLFDVTLHTCTSLRNLSDYSIFYWRWLLFCVCGLPCKLVWFVFVGVGSHLDSQQMCVMLNGVFYNTFSCKDPSWILVANKCYEWGCVFQGVHLWMYGEVLWCLGCNTSIQTWTSLRSYTQRCLLLHFFLHTSYSWFLVAKDCDEWGCVFQGVHFQMCSEVLQCLGSNTSIHIRTSARSYTQQHLL